LSFPPLIPSFDVIRTAGIRGIASGRDRLLWLAVDRDGHVRDGHVAWLVTGGSAVVPPCVEREPDTFGEAEETLPSLPTRGGAESRELSARYIRDWLEAARRGVFGYDWPIYDGPYKLVARPENPIDVNDLPPKLAELARRTRFEHLCFNVTARASAS
jgi:hypothetical protein